MSRNWRVFHCIYCGRSFLASTTLARYCSQSCKARERNAVRMLERTSPPGVA